MYAETFSTVIAMAGSDPLATGVTLSQCSLYLANPDPATTNKTQAPKTMSVPARTRTSTGALSPARPPTRQRSQVPALITESRTRTERRDTP